MHPLVQAPFLQPAPSAGGAPTDQLLIVTGFTAFAYAVLGWVILRERQGRRTLVGRVADLAASYDGGPRWFALPALISITGALSGAVGVYWDVSYHITKGRDEGPLANPSHYLIFLGLLAIFFGGALAMALAGSGRAGDAGGAGLPRRTLRITRTWRTPLGPATVTGIALCALAGFPMDDVWHRIFGQDVTEWGPTHILMIGGTILLPYGLLLSAAEARQVSRSRVAPLFSFVAQSYLVIGPVAFLLEYAFGVPQFPLIMDVIVMTLGAAAGLVMASHRGTAYVVGVWAFFVGVQLLLLGMNHFVWHALSPRFPLLIGGMVAAAVLARLARPTARYGALAGAVVGVATVPVELITTNALRPVEWPAAMLPWAFLFAAGTGAGAGVLVTWLHTKLVSVYGDTLTSPARPADRRVTGGMALAGLITIVAVFAWNAPPRADLTANVDVTVETPQADRSYVDVQIDPALVDGSYWFHVLSWQGGGMVRSELEPTDQPGVYRSADPIPVTGEWKSLVRLHRGLHTMVSAPVYLPADPAIPAPEYPAGDGLRPLVSEHQILQRELKDDVPTWLWSAGYLSVGLVFVVLFGVVAAGYTLAGRPGSGTESIHLPRRSRHLSGARG